MLRKEAGTGFIEPMLLLRTESCGGPEWLIGLKLDGEVVALR